MRTDSITILLTVFLAAGLASASSHRDAPFPASEPATDLTDLYIFRNPDSPSDVVMVMSVWPFADPIGAPNYTQFGYDVTYRFNIDNDADSQADIVWEYTFSDVNGSHVLPVDDSSPHEFVWPHVPGLTIDTPGDPDLVTQTEYTVRLIVDPGAPGEQVFPLFNDTISQPIFLKPGDPIGSSTIPDYENYAAQHVWDWSIPALPSVDGRVFVGLRDDPYAADLGAVIDALDVTIGPDERSDSTAGHAVFSFALEAPISLLDPLGSGSIGAWATVEIPRVRRLNPAPNGPGDVLEPFDPQEGTVQVSRLGHPLVSELLIGLGAKDAFNFSRPADDLQFDEFFRFPTLAELMGGPSSNRTDLQQLYLQGPPGSGFGEKLRLDLTVAPLPAAQQRPLGPLDTPPDPAGFPNGRRPGDDVVDVTLTLIAGDGSPRSDGVQIDATQFPTTFPFLNSPIPPDRRLVCVDVVSAQDPAAPFAPVEGAYVTAAAPSEILVPLDPQPATEFFLVQRTPAPRRILLGREGARIRILMD